MIYLIVFGVILAIVGILVAMAKNSGKQEVRNEALQRESSLQKRQIDIAGRPADSDNDVINWLRDSADKERP